MRKTSDYIATTGRDAGKLFRLTEMPASKAEKWATRAMLAFGKSGVEVPAELAGIGMAGLAPMIATLGFRALFGLQFADAEPLLDEMMGCVQIMPDPSVPAVLRGLIEEDIEEVQTRILIRNEVVALHVGFSLAAKLRELGDLAKTRANSPTTRTSRKRSPR